MDDIKLRLNESVAARLSAAPASADKDELIEELSDNLYRRFLDMTGAGVPEEEAFRRALDDLGDVDELLSYLGVEPDGDVTIDQGEGQTRITARKGQTIVINGGDGEPVTINTGDGQPITVNSGEPFTVTGEEAEAAPEESQPQGRTDARGDVHFDFHADAPQSDLDAIFANVSEICNTAIDQAKAALKQAKDAMKRRTTWEKDNGRVKVHFNTHPDGPAPTPPAPPEPPEAPEAPQAPEAPEAPKAPEAPMGWEFEAELDSDEGRFFAGAGPKERKDVVYGFGYDKARGGFFAQWGEYQGESQEFRGPRFTGESSGMHPNDDGSYSVTALKDLRGIEVFTAAGDVTIHMDQAPDAGVIIDGDVDDLDVTCSADGVLTIREGRTASSSFFSRRGFHAADVELYLPRRYWETISITTASGDVDIDRDALDIGQLSVRTASGDLSCRLRACTQLAFYSASGDIELEGSCAQLQAETISGDISFRGQVDSALLKSASGDIELEGLTARLRASTVSGDVRLETSQLPQAMELSSKSGDVEVRMPDAGPFTLRMKTVSGEMDCQLRMNYIDGVFVCGDGSGPSYSMTTVSGDVRLERY